MATIMRFEDIESWKMSREQANWIYDASNKGAFARDFALKDQIRRAAISVMSNIAEGFERDGNKEFIHFLSIAKGSCGELRSQLYLARDQNFITEEEFTRIYNHATRTSKAISGFMSYLINNPIKGLKYKEEVSPFNDVNAEMNQES